MSSDASDGSLDSLLRRVACAPPEEPEVWPAPGEVLGRFVIGERLGSGATGVVHAAHDRHLDREVALKILSRGASRRDRSLGEARAAARVLHSGVATIHDACELEGRVLLVQERVRGETLRAELTRRGRLAPREAARVVAEIARAVDAAHAVDVVHCDLKPDNVMIPESGGVKVLDFGLAALLGPDDDGAGHAGTRAYAAPEALTGRASFASDQYALGVILVELVTGRRPPAHRAQETLVLTGMPRALRAIAQRATAVDPAQRFASCGALSIALERRPSAAPRVLAAVGLVGLCGAAVALPLSRSGPGGADASPTQSKPTSGLPAPLACPALATDDPADGWLGAAAASLACRHARARFGGARSRVVPPAALLDLPMTPVPSFPADPFGEPQASSKARAAANAAHLDILDGRVIHTGATFRVTLELRRDGAESSTSSGEGPLVVAVTHAVDALFDAGDLEQAAAVDPDVAAWEAVSTIQGLRARAFLEGAINTGGAIEAADVLFRDDGAALGPSASSLLASLEASVGAAHDEHPPALDRGSVELFAITAPEHVLGGGATPPLELAEELSRAREALPDASRRQRLSASESVLRLAGGQRDEARALALAAASFDAWDAPWDVLAHASFGRPEMATLSRAYRAWRPEVADAWNIAAHVDAEGEERLRLLERAVALGDLFPLFAGNLGAWLVMDGRVDEARALAARLDAGNLAQRVAGARLRVHVALHEGRVLGAYESAWRTLDGLARIGSIETGDVALVATLVELGGLLGRQREVGARVYASFVAPEPPRLDRGAFAEGAIAHACAYAAAPVARRCFARLDELHARGYFPLGGTGDADAYVEGARLFAAGDSGGAIRAFRRARADLGARASVPALAFERAGELGLADAIDPVQPGLFGGVSSSHLRAARRAVRRGRCEIAVPLARGVVEAWSAADVDLAAVHEARAIERACCDHRGACG